MRYCTRQDLIDTYGEQKLAQLTDRVNMPATTIDDALVDAAIAHAEAEINMYLEGRYQLPLAKGSVMLTRIACDLAWYNLHTQVDEDHPAAQAYKRRKAQLDGVAARKLGLGLDEDDAPVPTSKNTVQVSPGRNDFSGKW
jgi:phage gp36-like protein